MGRQQALAGGEHRSASVALDRAALEHEVQLAPVGASHRSAVVEAAVDGIVLVRLKLPAPSVEAEVEQQALVALAVEVFQRDEPMVARPCVVGGTLVIDDVGGRRCRQGTVQQPLHLVGAGRHNQQPLMVGYLAGHLHIGRRDVAQHVVPVRLGVGPGQLDGALRLPFCG